MKITDKEVIRQLKIVRCGELEENLETYPEDELEGRSEMQMLADEASYLISMYEEEGTGHNDDLVNARHFMKETKNGTQIPFYNTFPPQPKYTPVRLEINLKNARNTINEYNRLRSLMERLNKKGYYGSW